MKFYFWNKEREQHRSLPVRGAWIEIVKGLVTVNGVQLVAPRAGSVD